MERITYKNIYEGPQERSQSPNLVCQGKDERLITYYDNTKQQPLKRE